MKTQILLIFCGFLETGAPPPAFSPAPRAPGTMRQAGTLVQTQVFLIRLKVLVMTPCETTGITDILGVFRQETL